MKKEQLTRMEQGKGFIAALDQSGGSTPKALAAYGITREHYVDEEGMYKLVHEMRTRIMTSSVFTAEHILGAILFENTMERQVDGKLTADYLWEEKNILPFLKIDKGLEEEKNGVQLMKPIENLTELLEKAKAHHIFGTKERSVIKLAREEGIKEVVAQQFELGKKVFAAGLIPIIEPEVDIHSNEKEHAEELLKIELVKQLDMLEEGVKVIFKLTLPSKPNFYESLLENEHVLRIVALSGGYSQNEANERLSQNKGVIASFSRALSQDLRVQQSDEEFDEILEKAIDGIYQASVK